MDNKTTSIFVDREGKDLLKFYLLKLNIHSLLEQTNGSFIFTNRRTPARFHDLGSDITVHIDTISVYTKDFETGFSILSYLFAEYNNGRMLADLKTPIQYICFNSSLSIKWYEN